MAKKLMLKELITKGTMFELLLDFVQISNDVDKVLFILEKFGLIDQKDNHENSQVTLSRLIRILDKKIDNLNLTEEQYLEYKTRMQVFQLANQQINCWYRMNFFGKFNRFKTLQGENDKAYGSSIMVDLQKKSFYEI